MRTANRRARTTQLDYESRLLRVLVHIQQRLDGVLELHELAHVACFSPYHFHRIFTGMTGETVKAHIRRLRLERAASQLKLTQWPVTQIAFAAGYETHEAFTRAFKSAFGVSPAAFQANGKGRAIVPAQSAVHFRNGKPPGKFKPKSSPNLIMKVQIKQLKPMRVAFVRHTGPYQKAGDAWARLLPFIGKEGLIGGDTLFLGISHDDPDVTPQEKIRYDACVTVDDGFKPTGEIGVQTVAGGEYAVTTHHGSYSGLGDTYSRLFGQWLPRSGRQARSAPCFEVYLNSPESTEPKDLITDVHLPLE